MSGALFGLGSRVAQGAGRIVQSVRARAAANPVAAGVAGVAGVAVLGAIGELYIRDFSTEYQSPIMFPSDLSSRNVPFMSMEFQRYQRRSINDQPFYTGLGKIMLPIPENLVETTSVTYSKEALNTVVGAAADSLAGSVGSIADSSSVGNLLSTLGGRITTAATGAGVGALQVLTGAAIGSIQDPTTRSVVGGLAGQTVSALSALSGITTNPFEVILFKSPEFRRHSFSWNFIPNSLEESQKLQQLIETFKYHSLPGISAAGGVFFSYPEILKINFRPSDEYMYKFKPCVIDSVRVNYAPNKPSFVKSSGAPTAIQFQINLQEIEIMTKADFLRDQRGIYRPTVGGGS
jgi:hypothetical protein